jgi:hypothetical protein
VRIVKSFEDVQIVLRDLLDWKSLLSTKDWDFKKLRIKNASPAVDPNDYVTLSQLGEQTKPIKEQVTNLSISQTSPGGGSSSSGTVTNTGTLVAGRLVIGNGGVDITQGSLTDETNNNVSSTSHGLVPKAPADDTKFLNGAATPAFALVKDSDLSTSDITTNDVSTSKHGFAPKLPNSASKYLDGTGAYSVPGGGGNAAGMPFNWLTQNIVDPSNDSAFAWANQLTGGTVTKPYTGMIQMLIPTGFSGQWQLRTKAIPATPYTVTIMLMVNFSMGGSVGQVGLHLYDSVGGKIANITVVTGTQSNGGINSQKFDNLNPGTFNSNYSNINYMSQPISPFLGLQITDDGTTRNFNYSVDGGNNWQNLTSHAHNNFVTPDKIAWGGYNSTGQSGYIYLISATGW